MVICGVVMVTRGVVMVTHGVVMVTRGVVMVTHGVVMVKRGVVMVTRGVVMVTHGVVQAGRPNLKKRSTQFRAGRVLSLILQTFGGFAQELLTSVHSRACCEVTPPGTK